MRRWLLNGIILIMIMNSSIRIGSASFIPQIDGLENLHLVAATQVFDSKGQLAVNKQTAEATVDINGFMKLGILTAAPASPSAGMVAIADGTSWDPMVTGKQTMVVYLGTGWVQIAVAA